MKKLLKGTICILSIFCFVSAQESCELDQELWQLTVDAADSQNIDPHLLLALFWRESAWCHVNEEGGITTSSKGALGLGQIMPSTATDLDVNPVNKEENAFGAAKYLRWQWDRFGNWEKALAAYNSGAENVEEYGGIPPFQETQDYVANILENYQEFKGRKELELPSWDGETIAVDIPDEVSRQMSVSGDNLTLSNVGLSVVNEIPGVIYVLIPTQNQRFPFEGAYLIPQNDSLGNKVYIMLTAPNNPLEAVPSINNDTTANNGIITFGNQSKEDNYDENSGTITIQRRNDE